MPNWLMGILLFLTASAVVVMLLAWFLLCLRLAMWLVWR